jgi:hypothetical protein
MQNSIEAPLDSIDLLPVNYFPLEFDCHYCSGGKLSGKYKIPSSSGLLCEEEFAAVSAGWNEEGISFVVSVQQPFKQSVFTDHEYGDSVEIFLDTRDIKSAGFNHRFCHHFVFLGEPVEGQQALETTRFRTEDVHTLCDPGELEVKTTRKRSSYEVSIRIPSPSLHGYDSGQFDRLGFTYRINRYGGAAQHFSLHASEYKIDQNPALWSTMRLVR